MKYRDFYQHLNESVFIMGGDGEYESKNIRSEKVYERIASELSDSERTKMIDAVAMQLEEIYEEMGRFYDSYENFKSVESLETWQLVRAVDEIYAYPCGWERKCEQNGLEKWVEDFNSEWSIDGSDSFTA